MWGCSKSLHQRIHCGATEKPVWHRIKTPQIKTRQNATPNSDTWSRHPTWSPKQYPKSTHNLQTQHQDTHTRIHTYTQIANPNQDTQAIRKHTTPNKTHSQDSEHICLSGNSSRPTLQLVLGSTIKSNRTEENQTEPNLNRTEPIRTGPDRSEPDWNELNWTILSLTEPDWTGPDQKPIAPN